MCTRMREEPRQPHPLEAPEVEPEPPVRPVVAERYERVRTAEALGGQPGRAQQDDEQDEAPDKRGRVAALAQAATFPPSLVYVAGLQNRLRDLDSVAVEDAIDGWGGMGDAA
ncbi:hypothetical protein PG994_006847 [Apiospora phragmitis]|uniref:Uncharacterized protein n=1 Tax=Apiospora phragmitis TaxID=2905665 RepID=A0ABR1VG75_9PEZI